MTATAASEIGTECRRREGEIDSAVGRDREGVRSDGESGEEETGRGRESEEEEEKKERDKGRGDKA